MCKFMSDLQIDIGKDSSILMSYYFSNNSTNIVLYFDKVWKVRY